MKVINIFVNSFPKTSETFVYNKVRSLLENGFKINIITSQKADTTSGLYEDLDHFKNFNQVVAPLNQSKSIGTVIGVLLHYKFYAILIKNSFDFKKSYKEFLIKKTLNLFSPDIIHFQFSGIGFNYLSQLDALKNVKIVSSFRGTAEKIKPLIDKKRFEQFPLFLEKLDVCHCVTQNMAQELEKYQVDKKKVFVNYPSIDINAFSYKEDYRFDPKKEINMVSVGRLNWIKGIDIALLALKKLKEHKYKFKYTLIGDGKELEKLKFIVQSLDLVDEVVFLGNISSKDVSKKLKESHLFLLPSYSEGMSNSALEAMCTGIPVISSKAGGMEEAIVHHKNGFLFEIGNANELYTNLKVIFESQFDLNAIRLDAHNTVKEKFNLENQIDKFKQLYTTL